MSHQLSFARAPTFAVAIVLLCAGSAFAAPRTYVASYGNDANAATNCAPTAPCRTFAAAMPVTDTAGQVIVLDSAGYGAVTITKSLSIIAPDGIYAGLTAASGNVVTIATAGTSVTLKGLTITGGNWGIFMAANAKLNVEHCDISGAVTTGISAESAGMLTVAHSTVRENGNGIIAGPDAIVNVMDAQVTNNTTFGIVMIGGTSGITSINVTDTVVTGSSNCIANIPYPGTTGIFTATRTTTTGCNVGFTNEALGTGTMTVSNSVAARNGIGFYSGGGTFESLGNNHVRQNGTNTSGTITVVPQN